MELNFPTERIFAAWVTRVVDGDTIVCDIDLGLRSWLRDYKVRLNGCNAWEISTEAGKAAHENLVGRLPVGTYLTLTFVKDYKYGGEFVATPYLSDGTDLVQQLIAQQWLAPWNGRGTVPVPPWPRTV